MNRAMAAMEMTGDPTRDFALMMIPHHQSAIGMATALLKKPDSTRRSRPSPRLSPHRR